LEFKFGILPKELIKAINDITDTDALSKLHRYAMECNSIAEFEKKMKLILEG